MSDTLTTIQITTTTRERMKNAARKDETYDQFINRLLDNSKA
jgi:hypothetical protein